MRQIRLTPTLGPAAPSARPWAPWLVLLAAFALTAPSGAGGLKVSGPAIELDPPRFNFGDLPQEHQEKVTCTIRNAGSDTLRISDISSDCGCTVAEIPDSSLAPGQSVGLLITFSTRHFSGQVIKNVTLTTNDPGSPKPNISLAAFVRAIVGIDPDALDFGAVSRGSTPSQLITLRSAAADTVRVQDVYVPEESFTYDLNQRSAGDSTYQYLRITLRPDAPVGQFSSSARIRTNVRSASQLTVNLKGQVYGFFLVEPGVVRLGQMRQGQERTRTLQLAAQRPGSHRLLGVRCSDERLRIEVSPLEEGRRYQVSVTVPPDALPGKISATLLIETDDPDEPEIKVRVAGTVLRRHSRG